MEYLLGAIVTLITMSVVAGLVKSPKNSIKRVRTNFNQSRQHELVKDFLPRKRKILKSQASKHFQHVKTRIIFAGNYAYWIEKSGLHKAEITPSGEINENTKIRVDTMGMDSVELRITSFIVDKLTEGLSNDSGDSGH